MKDAELIQREYYKKTASEYDRMHVDEGDEHFFALAFMIGMIDHFEINSILDVGSGTGRALLQIKKLKPKIKVLGIEPSSELREIGYSKGLKKPKLIGGDAEKMPFKNGQFDLVCEFGMLHHIPRPERAIAEMLRVSKKAIFISDCNNFGQGKWFTRTLKQLINTVGLWPAVNFLKTKGKGYAVSEGDGLYYSYSVFNNLKQIRASCRSVRFLNTVESDVNLYKSSSHIALLGIK